MEPQKLVWGQNRCEHVKNDQRKNYNSGKVRRSRTWIHHDERLRKNLLGALGLCVRSMQEAPGGANNGLRVFRRETKESRVLVGVHNRA